MTMRGLVLRALPLALLLGISASQAQAAHLVTFTRGQSIVAQSVEKRGNWYYFGLDGGGEMGVLASQVVRIEDYEAPPPSAVASAPSQPVPAPVPAPAPQGSPADNSGGQQLASDGSTPGADAQPADESTANVMQRGNDSRFRARMSGGPSIQQGGGGMRKPPGMGAGVGVGRIGAANQNPYNRRTPPPQTGNPTQ
jgi:hypothetical protein